MRPNSPDGPGKFLPDISSSSGMSWSPLMSGPHSNVDPSTPLGKRVSTTWLRTGVTRVSVTGGVHGLYFFVTILYGRPHGSALRDANSSSQQRALDFLMALLRALLAAWYVARASTLSSSRPCRGIRERVRRARTEERRNSANSSVHQYVALLGRDFVTRGI